MIRRYLETRILVAMSLLDEVFGSLDAKYISEDAVI